jgi:hypothetical protein
MRISPFRVSPEVATVAAIRADAVLVVAAALGEDAGVLLARLDHDGLVGQVRQAERLPVAVDVREIVPLSLAALLRLHPTVTRLTSPELYPRERARSRDSRLRLRRLPSRVFVAAVAAEFDPPLGDLLASESALAFGLAGIPAAALLDGD